MCLAVPGKIVKIEDRDGTLMSVVDFGETTKDVCLQYLPDAEVGQYVVVHVGFAIQRLDDQEAQRTLAEFELAAMKAGIEIPNASPANGA